MVIIIFSKMGILVECKAKKQTGSRNKKVKRDLLPAPGKDSTEVISKAMLS
jgi:hypothetical protein